jgi:hypothetical protein
MFNPSPLPQKKFRGPSKIVPHSTRLWKLLKLHNLGHQHPNMFVKRGSKILKLPPVRNCFTLAMTNKLVVIINSLKVPKIKKILLYEMKFLVPNYSCLQNPWLGGVTPPTPPFSLSSIEFVYPSPTPSPEQNSWVRHWVGWLDFDYWREQNYHRWAINSRTGTGTTKHLNPVDAAGTLWAAKRPGCIKPTIYLDIASRVRMRGATAHLTWRLSSMRSPLIPDDKRSEPGTRSTSAKPTTAALRWRCS